MKTNLNFFSKLIIIIFLLFLVHDIVAQTKKEQVIKSIALDYVEGWYSADTSRMANALARDLNKKGFVIQENTNQIVKKELDYSQMIDLTQEKSNELKQNPNMNIEVEIIKIGQNIAIVKTMSPDYIDYLHMGNLEGNWKIYNIIYEPNYDETK